MRRCLMIMFALTALCASPFAEARPPTVMNSPGYDARLQESRKALNSTPTTTEPAAPPVTAPKKSRKKQTN